MGRRNNTTGEVYDIAKAMLLKGTSPDGKPWNGGAPRIGMSYVNPAVRPPKETVHPKDGSVTFRTTWVYGYNRFSDGYYCDDFRLIQRFRTAHPAYDTTLESAFYDIAESRQAKLTQEIKKFFQTQTWKPFSDLKGVHGSAEWETPTLVSFQGIDFETPPGGILSIRDKLKLKVVVGATINAVPLDAVTDRPFSNMSDRELNEWVAFYEGQAPENFWMDGELRMSRLAVYAMYRKRWRAMSPRAQTELLKSFQRNKRASGTTKLAQRYFQALED